MTTRHANPNRAAGLMAEGARMRTGRTLGRTLYLVRPGEEDWWDAHLCVGIVDSAELAGEVCRRWNADRG